MSNDILECACEKFRDAEIAAGIASSSLAPVSFGRWSDLPEPERERIRNLVRPVVDVVMRWVHEDVIPNERRLERLATTAIEREACAKIADGAFVTRSLPSGVYAADVAAEIRARGE